MKKILLLYTGGTIGMEQDPISGVLVPFSLKALVRQIPEILALDIEVETVSITNPIDSANASVSLWQEIGVILSKNREGYNAFLVLHGTDTMTYSATACAFMLQGFNKPIVFTGSQLPISDPKTDAKSNVLGALNLLSSLINEDVIINEVGIYFDQKLFRAARSTKIHSSDFDGFGCPNDMPLVNGKEISLERFLKGRNTFRFKPNFLSKGVEVLYWHPLIEEKALKTILQSDIEILIIQSYGSGTLPIAEWVLNNFKDVISRGIKIIICSQCFKGGVTSGIYETSNALENLGVLYASDITLESIIIKSAWLSAQKLNDLEFKAAFFEDYCGELG